MVKRAKKLHRYPVMGRWRSLGNIVVEIAEHAFVGRNGESYAAMAVKRMLA